MFFAWIWRQGFIPDLKLCFVTNQQGKNEFIREEISSKFPVNVDLYPCHRESWFYRWRTAFKCFQLVFLEICFDVWEEPSVPLIDKRKSVNIYREIIDLLHSVTVNPIKRNKDWRSKLKTRLPFLVELNNFRTSNQYGHILIAIFHWIPKEFLDLFVNRNEFWLWLHLVKKTKRKFRKTKTTDDKDKIERSINILELVRISKFLLCSIRHSPFYIWLSFVFLRWIRIVCRNLFRIMTIFWRWMNVLFVRRLLHQPTTINTIDNRCIMPTPTMSTE